jgi:WD40 repeat protein/uncharacterized caspase-like protein
MDIPILGKRHTLMLSRISLLAILWITLCGARPEHLVLADEGTARLSQPQNVLGASKNAPELIVQLSHAGEISAMALSASGRFLITAAWKDQTMLLWNTGSGRQLRHFKAPDSDVIAIDISRSEEFVLTGSYDGAIRLWKTDDGEEILHFRGHSGPVYAVAFSPDARFVLTGGSDKTVCLWRRGVTKPVWKSEFPDEVRAIAYSPNGRNALVSNGLTASLINIEDGRKIGELGEHTGGVSCVAFSASGDLAITGTENKEVHLWDIKAGKKLKSFPGHEDVIIAVSFSPDDRLILTASKDRTARLLNATSAEEVCHFGKHAGPVHSAAISKGGRFVFTASKRTAYAWNVEKCLQVLEFKGDSEALASAVAFSPDDRFIATGSWDNTARLWDTISGNEVRILRGHAGHVREVTFSPDGLLVLTGSRDETARIWETRSGQEVHTFEGASKKGVRSVSFSPPDGRRILTGGDDGYVRIWTAKKPFSQIQSLGRHSGRVTSATFSPPDGRSVITASKDPENILHLWDADSGNEINRFTGHSETVNSVAFSSDGRLALSASDDKTVRIWNAGSGKEILRLEHPVRVYTAIFSPQDRLVLTGSDDGIARLWDAIHGKQVGSFQGHTSRVVAVSFSPNERLIATSSEDQTIRLWEAASGRQLATLISFSNGTWLVVTPDGRFETDNLDEIKGLHWIMPDDPMKALPPELFMRDYYEPKLLPRLLSGKKNEFKEVCPLQSLNRAQPQVKEIRLSPGKEPGSVAAEVDVEGGSYKFERTGETKVTGVYDLRLFRDGQLVGQYPEPKESTPDGVSGPELKQWQEDTRVVEAEGKKTVPFRCIKLPHRSGKQPAVEFTAYAFNEDRVKSETAKATTQAVPGKAEKKAYLVAVGVDDYGGLGWDLEYAAKDAPRMVEVLGPRLAQAGYTLDPKVLVSDMTQEEATKEKIRAAIEGLAGKSTPDDVVVVFFSGHGYAGEHSAFYLLPSDSQPGRENWSRPSAEALRRCISAEELSRWFRRVDAAEMVLIIDACHSAASIESEGFKPGPLGSKGLGQLAYDKRMRVLAASQSDQAAREMGGQIGAGVLTYTLLHDGLEANQAADEKGKITLRNWLEYPVRRVPQLFEEIRAGRVNDFGVPVEKTAVPAADVGGIQREGAVQMPALFDFTRAGGAEVTLGGTIQTSSTDEPIGNP